MRLFVLIFLGILLVAGVYFANDRWRRVLLPIALVAVCLLPVIVLLPLINLYLDEQMVEGYADNVASAFGVSPLLAKAAAFALFLPVGLALTWVIFDPAKRLWGSSILAAAAVVYFLALWVATKDQPVSRRGEPLQCYVVTERGIVWRDIRYAGTDPATGRPCEPAKPHLLPSLARLDGLLRSGRPLEPIDPRGRFFTPTGEALVWYHRTRDGDLEFYDAPGFRPRSGDQLQPVTGAVAEEWKRREAVRGEAERQRAVAHERAVLEAAAATERRREENRRTHMRNLVAAGAVGNAGRTLGLAIMPTRPDSALDRLAAERLPELLARRATDAVHVIPAMFTDGFAREGHFARAFAGIVNLTRERSRPRNYLS
jgi:hypothetical protein